MRSIVYGPLLVALAGCATTGPTRQCSSTCPREKCAATGFSTARIDVGVVCSDVKKSIEFYTKAIGFTEVEPFDVDAKFGADSGLSDNQAFHVHVLKLVDCQNATKLKLIQFPNKPGKKSDESFIHSTYGYSYLTIFVSDMNVSLERAKKAKGTIVAKSPVIIGTGPDWLTLLRDPDGNLIELVGPRK